METYYSYSESRNGSIVKVFGYMFLGLLVTALSAYGVAYLLSSGMIGIESYAGLAIVSAIGLLILVFVSQFYCLKNKIRNINCFVK